MSNSVERIDNCFAKAQQAKAQQLSILSTSLDVLF